MGTQSKIGNPELFSGRHGRWVRRRRRQMHKMRVRGVPTTKHVNKDGDIRYTPPLVREFHPNANREDVPHEGKKQKAKIRRVTRRIAGLRPI